MSTGLGAAGQRASSPATPGRPHPGAGRGPGGRDWDAATYDRISGPQEAFAREQLSRLELRGDEVVLDAGCGSGKVSALLADRVPRGRVYAVDVAPSMVAHTRAALGERVIALCQDLTELALPEPVDAVFSNAVFHWVKDHPRLFASLAAVLRPGGQLVAQCGGLGNVERLRVESDAVMRSARFARWFEGWEGPWNYAPPELTAQRLRTAGFTDVHTWLEPKPTPLTDGRTFVEKVCLLRNLERLPEELRAGFVDAVIERIGEPITLDYVRLNMTARRVGAANE